MSDEPETLPLEVTVEQVKDLRGRQPAPLLIDVREPDEYAICHLEGSRLLPLSGWPQEAARHNGLFETNAPVIVYCHHGARSMRAAMFLRSRGVKQAQSMAGGVEEWALRVDPNMERY
jgi:rhodanese-related sulfurtransferase